MFCVDHHYSELFLVEKKVKFGCFNFSAYKGIAKVARAAVGKKWWIF